MENITIGQIAVVLAFIAAFITSVVKIKDVIEKTIKKGLEGQFKPINEKLDTLDKKIDDVDLNACKNFLVARLDEIEKGEAFGAITDQRFWEQYNHYLAKGGNTYIQHRIEKLQQEGKL